MSKQKEDSDWIPCSKYLDFIKSPVRTFVVVFLIRFGLSMSFGFKDYHPDQHWQGYEMAYKIAYSDVVDVVATWEWLDLYALRSHLYPAYLSTPLHLLRFL